MILIVDEKKFVTYELDFYDDINSKHSTIKNRIAYQNGILPEYLVLQKTPDEGGNIKTINFFNIIDKYQIHELPEFYKEYKDIFDLDLRTVALTWYNTKIKTLDPYTTIMLDEFLIKESDRILSLSKIQMDLQEFNKTFTSRLSTFLKNMKQEVKLFKEFEQLKPVHSTPLELLKVTTELSFEVDYDIYELFNYLKLSKVIPFATIDNYYKPYKEFKPLKSWTYSNERLEGAFPDKKDVLYIKVLNVRDTYIDTDENIVELQRKLSSIYSTVSIYFESADEEYKRKKKEDDIKYEKEQQQMKKQEKIQLTKLKEKYKTVEKGKKLSGEKKEELKEYKTKMETLRKKIEKRRIEEEEKKIKEYIPIISKSNKVYIRIESSINLDFTEDELLSRILSVFPQYLKKINIDNIIKNKKHIQIKGEFLVPQLYLDSSIFSDLILTHPIFYRLLSIDDRSLFKEAGGTYLHFFFSPTSSDSDVSCSLTEQTVEKTSTDIISKDPLLKVDTSYLKVRITRSKSEYDSIKFQNLFCRLLTLYSNSKNSVVKKYEKYLPNFQNILDKIQEDIEGKRKKSTRTKKMLKDTDPDIFISGYARMVCPSSKGQDRAPEIVSEDEKEKLEEKDIQVVQYPKDPSEGSQRYYTCNNKKEHKFFGLKLNTLENKDKYPLVPCCFKKMKGQKSEYWQYYFGGKSFNDFRDVKKEKEVEHVITTDKILPQGRTGTFDPIDVKNIKNFFNAIDSSYNYERLGVSRNYNSILEVLLFSTSTISDNEDNFILKTLEEKEEMVQNVRRELIELVKTDNSIYQEMYMYTKERIIDYLEDFERYLDPKLFIKLLENYFNCYIFIFTRDSNNPFGILNVPYHSQEYILQKRNPNLPYVLIYEHFGTEVDAAKYPQCELIFQINPYPKVGEKQNVYIFNSKYDIIKKIKNVFEKMYLSLYYNPLKIKFNSEIIGQKIDYNGKTRFLQFKIKTNEGGNDDEEICILTEPLPPLFIKQEVLYKPVSTNIANKFLQQEEIKDYKEKIVDGFLIGLYAEKIIDNNNIIKFYIPLIPEVVQSERNVDIATPSFLIKGSEIEYYNEYHRLARYLTEYFLYLFSLYYLQYEVSPQITPKFIKEFINKNIEIDNNFKYTRVTRSFSLEDSGLIRNKKLVLHNEEIVKRLVYGLRLKLRDNEDEVKYYSKYKYIQQYYTDIRDFDKVENQIILQGQNSLIQWVDSQKPIYKLYDNVQHTGVSLVSELLKLDKKKMFILLFVSDWNKQSHMFINKISSTRKKDEKIRESLVQKYSDNFNFIVIDIDKNKSVAEELGVVSVPYIYFLKIKKGDKVEELSKIDGSKSNLYNNYGLLKREIDKILG